MPRCHRKCHQRKGGAKINYVQQNTEPTSTQVTTTNRNKDEPKNASSLEDTLSQASSTGDDNNETDDDNDEPHTKLLDSNETSTPDFGEILMNQYDQAT